MTKIKTYLIDYVKRNNKINFNKKLSNRERFTIKQNLLKPLGSEGQYQRVCHLCP